MISNIAETVQCCYHKNTTLATEDVDQSAAFPAIVFLMDRPKRQCQSEILGNTCNSKTVTI